MKKLNYFFSSALLAVILFASVTVMGQTPFYVDLLQPNTAGIDIVIGDDYLISWEDNLSQPVDVFIDRNDTHGFVLLSSGVGITGSTWIWDTDSESVANGCKIRIKSDISPDTYYTSGVETFDLVPYASTDIIVVEQPSVAGISWAQGSTHTIYWSNTIGDAVKVEYSYDNKVSYSTIVGGASVTGNSIDWTVPSTPSTTCYVKVTGASGLTAESVHPFTITLTSGTVQEIYQPNDQSVWSMDNKYLISWRDDLTELVDIYIKDITATTAKVQIAADVSGSTYEWNLATLPLAYPFVDNNIYEIIIQSNINGSTEFESEQFKIVDALGSVSIFYQPKADNSTSWTRGTRHLISWLDDLTGTVDVLIYQDAILVTTISNVTGTTCYWDIDGNATLASDYTVFVRSHDDPTNTNLSNTSSTFTVTASSGTTIEVLQPSVLGLNWAFNTSHLISWSDDFAENVQIELFSYTNALGTTGEANLGDIITSVANSTYIWDIDVAFPGVYNPDLFYKVRIRSVDDNSIDDMSANTFTINQTAGTYIDVLDPDGGEQWVAGTSHLISWIDDLPENVYIELYDYAVPITPVKIPEGVSNLPDVTTYPGSTMTWDIPIGLPALSTYRIKISSVLDPVDIDNFSDGDFTIWPVGKSPITNSNFNLDLVSVYPNPANGTVNIFTPVAMSQVEVRNMLGQVIYTNDIGNEKTTIDISSYDTGMYIVNIIVEGNVVTKKLFVQ